MTISTNHILQKAKAFQQVICLGRQNSPGRYFASGGN